MPNLFYSVIQSSLQYFKNKADSRPEPIENMESEISTEDARHALGEIETTKEQARHFAAAATASPILYTWGFVWLFAYGLCHFFPERSGAIWGILVALGVALTILFSNRAPVRSKTDSRFGFAWVILFAFAGVWMAILVPWNHLGSVDPMQMHRSTGAYGATLAMFAYVMMGLWWDRFFMWLGLLVTALTLVGYFQFPEYFNLWMAGFGGGLLLVSGALIKRRWNPAA